MTLTAAPSTTNRPTPARPTALRRPNHVNVGISAITHHATTAWGLVISSNAQTQTFIGTLATASTGEGLFAAFEAMSTHPLVQGATVTLSMDSFDHRPMFKDIAARLPRLSLRPNAGSFGDAARRAALTLLPDFPFPLAPIARRVTIATDGSCGQVKRGERGIGAGWIADTGKYGHVATNDFKTPLDGELHAIYSAVKGSRKEQPVHIVCDSQDALAIMGHLLAGEQVPGALPRNRADLITNLRRILPGRDITTEWVRGHDVHPLNIAADRLAVGARRIHQMGLPEADFAPIAERIAADYLSGEITAEVLAETSDDIIADAA